VLDARHGKPIWPRAILGACIEIFGFFIIVKTMAIELTFASFDLSDWTGQGVRSNKCQARSGQWQHHNIL